jgi:hypothetical protein
MDISYKEFEELYLHQAKVLTRDMADPEAAQKLCKTAYQTLDRQDRANCQEVFVTLAEIRYSDLFRGNDLPLTAQVAGLIYGQSEATIYDNWISFEDCLNKLSRVLVGLPLIVRMVAAFRILGWNNEAIAGFFNQVLRQLAEFRQPVQELSDVAQLLTKFRELAVNRVRAIAGDAEDWLVKLIFEKGDVESEFRTWAKIENLFHEPAVTRFARRSNPERDKYGVVRDQWDSAKEHIIQKLKVEELSLKRNSKRDKGEVL